MIRYFKILAVCSGAFLVSVFTLNRINPPSQIDILMSEKSNIVPVFEDLLREELRMGNLYKIQKYRSWYHPLNSHGFFQCNDRGRCYSSWIFGRGEVKLYKGFYTLKPNQKPQIRS